MNNKPVTKKSSDAAAGYYLLGMVIGFAAGIAIGIAMDSLPIGIAIGSGMGVSLGIAFQESKRRDKTEPVQPTKSIIIAVLVGLIIFAALTGAMLFIFLAR